MDGDRLPPNGLDGPGPAAAGHTMTPSDAPRGSTPNPKVVRVTPAVSGDGVGGGGGGGGAFQTPDAKATAIDQSSRRSRHSAVDIAKTKWRDFVDKAVTVRRKTFEYADDSGRIPLITKVVYGLPQFSLTSLTMLIGIHGTIFYTKIGADVAFIAFFTALARSFDVVTDPVMGWLSDQTRSKYGRRRPYFLAGCLPYALLFYALFTPPESLTSGASVALWFGCFYVCFYLFDTMGNVPYSALGPELSDDSEQRDSLFFWAKLFNGIGILCGAVGPVMLTIAFRSGEPRCQCDTSCPPGPEAAAEAGLSWDSAAYGLYESSWYNTSACIAVDGTTASSDTYTTALRAWCSCQGDCSADCDVAVARSAFSTTALIFGGVYVGAMVSLFLAIRERKASLEATAPPIVPALLATLRNRPFIGLLPAWVCDMTAYTMIGTMLPFYVEYVIVPSSVPECSDGKRAAFGLENFLDAEDESWCKSETWLGLGLVMLIGAQISSMPFWLWATKRFGKFRTWLAFNASTAVTNGLFVFIGRGDPKFCMGLAVLNGFPSGAQFLTDSVVADVIDYDEFLTGQRSEARFTIFQTFIPKIVSIPAQAIPLAFLTLAGFQAPVNGVPITDQGDGVKTFIQIIFFVLPCGLAVLSFVIKSRFPLRTPEITRKVQEGAAIHMAKEPARDPITGKTTALFEFASKEEEHMSWQLDNFFTDQLEMLVADKTEEGQRRGSARLAAALKWRVTQFGSIALASLAVVIVSVATGTLTDASLSWIPAFAVISFGMATTALVFNHVRHTTAKLFVADGYDVEFVQRWLYHLKGCDSNGETLPDIPDTYVEDVDDSGSDVPKPLTFKEAKEKKDL